MTKNEILSVFSDVCDAGYPSAQIHRHTGSWEIIVHSSDRQYYLSLSDIGRSYLEISHTLPQIHHERTINYDDVDTALRHFHDRICVGCEA